MVLETVERHEPLEGSRDMPPENFEISKPQNASSSTLEPISVSKRFPKTCFFLSFDKKSVVISYNIFSYLLLSYLFDCSQNSMVVSHEGPKSAQCGFIFCSFTLREFSVSSLGKRSLFCVSQRHGVNGLVN